MEKKIYAVVVLTEEDAEIDNVFGFDDFESADKIYRRLAAEHGGHRVKSASFVVNKAPDLPRKPPKAWEILSAPTPECKKCGRFLTRIQVFTENNVVVFRYTCQFCENTE